MIFQILGGGPVRVATDQELIEALRQDSMAWAPSVGIEDFMEGMAQRAEVQKGVPIRTDSIRAFLFDLQLHGFLTPLVDPWLMISMDEIKIGLYGPTAPTGWEHRLIWSSELPFILSVNITGQAIHNPFSGYTVHRPIHVSELSKPGYQRAWLQEHLASLRRQKM